MGKKVKDGKKKGKKGKAVKVRTAKKLTATQQRELEQEIRKLKGQNYSDYEIIDKLCLQPHIYKQYLARIYDIDREQYNHLDSVSVYSDFVEKSRENIKALDKMQKRFDYRKQFTAMVAAIKQKHDINKDVVKLGQQLGFIEDKGGEVSVETEMTFSTMTTEDVKQQVADEVAKLNELANGNVIEMRPELLATLEADEKRVKKFIPAGVIPEEPMEERPKKKKVKTKVKLKLKRRR